MANNIPTTTEISLDDADLEFDLQDEDFIGDNNVSNGNIEPTAQTPSIETSQTALNDPELQLRKKAIHIRGVDEMSSEDLTLYGKCYIPNLPFRIEWVDDSSSFFSEEEAAEALVGLTDPSEFYDSESIAPLQLRRAKSVPERESIKLQVRVATEQDRKERGARARSRYYLMHGEPTRELTRHRRKQEDEYIVYHLDRQRAKRQAESEDLLPGVLAKEADNDLFPDMARDKYEHKTAREHKQKLNKNDSTRFRDSSHSEHDFSQRVGVRERSPLRADRSNNKNGDLLPQVKNKPSYLSGNDDSITRTRSRSRSPDFGSRLQLTKENRPRRHRRHRRKAEDLF